MKDLNICFDSRILMNEYKKNSCRSGIFFVAKNILSVMAKRNVNLYLYFENKSKYVYKIIEDLNINIPQSNILYESSDFSEINTFFSPVFTIPEVLNNYPKISKYILVHDVIPLLFPEYYNFNYDDDWFLLLSKSIQKNDTYLFSNSDYTKQDFLKYFPQLEENKIYTIPLSTNIKYKPNKDIEQLKKAYKKYNIPQDKKYLFSLCSLEPRKNLIRAVKTFIEFIEKHNIENLVYVLGGGAWDGFIEKFEKEVPNYKQYKDRIIKAGYIDDEDMEILYSNAEWFVYTSQYEGFGMPPLEAMNCGCPVITSNNSSLPEVVGDAGIMIDYNSDEQHIKAYEKYFYDKAYRDEMSLKGLERSKLFSWEDAVDIILKEMQEVEQKKSNRPLVTVVTHTHNVIKNNNKEKFVKYLESIKNQTYENIEHIIIDESSMDGTLELLEEYKKRANILYYSEKTEDNLKINGKYVLYANNNNYYNSYAIEGLVSKSEELDADICYANNKPSNVTQNYLYDTNFLIFNTSIHDYTYLIKTDILEEFGENNIQNKIDFDISILYKMLQNNKKFVKIKQKILNNKIQKGFLNKNDFVDNIVNSFYENYGKYHNFTKFDIYLLTSGQYKNLPLEQALSLNSKIVATGNADWVNEFFRTYIECNKKHLNGNKCLRIKPLTFKEICKQLLSEIFSIKNEYKNNKKRKVVRILGFKFKFKM